MMSNDSAQRKVSLCGVGILRLCVCVLVFCAAACVPAEVPEQVEQTPGMPIRVAGGWVQTAYFDVQHPAGWRVIASAAHDPLTLVFAAPENDALIVLSIQPVENPPQPQTDLALDAIRHEIMLDDLRVYAYGAAPVEAWEAFLEAFEQVAASVAVPVSASAMGAAR